MRRFVILVLLLLVAAGIGWCYLRRESLLRQWNLHELNSTEKYESARAEIAWFETEPDRDEKLRELVGDWGIGKPRLDLHLARYLSDPDCTEALRKEFSHELSWRGELLPRWSHYWSWRTKLEPNEELLSIDGHLTAILSDESAPRLSWRQILELQALFYLQGKPQYAQRLTPDNWRDRYRDWLRERPTPLPHVERPKLPFVDWQGALPAKE
jgi:hypothetical protein